MNQLFKALSVFIIGSLLGCLLMKQCTPKLISSSSNDTLSVQSRVDTVWAERVVNHFKTIYKPIHDTIYKIDSSLGIDPEDLFFVREYNDSLVDTNQVVYSHVKTLGILEKLDISYKLKIPIRINTTNTITLDATPPYVVKGGVDVGGNLHTFGAAGFLQLDKKDNTYRVSFNPFAKTINIGVGLTLYKAKK